MCAAGWELRGHAEDGVDELALRYSIALSDPADLTFADNVHRLVTLDRSAGTLHRSEPEARRNSLLDEPMVLLDDVVQIGRRSATTARLSHRSASTRRLRWHKPDARRR